MLDEFRIQTDSEILTGVYELSFCREVYQGNKAILSWCTAIQMASSTLLATSVLNYILHREEFLKRDIY